MAETPPPPVVDQAKAVTPAQGDTVAAPPPEQTAKTPDPVAESVEEFTPPEEHRKSWNDLPADQRKLVNRIYTQQRQQDAAKLKEIEAKAGLADALARDPVGTFRTLEAQLRGTGLLKDGQDNAQKDLTKNTETLLSSLNEHLGPETADVLRKVIRAELQAQSAPTQQAVYQMASEITQAKAQADIVTFEAKHPTWKKHEAKMADLARKLTDNGRLPVNMPGSEWLEHLWRNVAFNDSVEEKVGATLQRMQQSAQSAEQPTAGVTTTRVAHIAPKYSDFKTEKEWNAAVAEASKRGVVWERG